MVDFCLLKKHSLFWDTYGIKLFFQLCFTFLKSIFQLQPQPYISHKIWVGVVRWSNNAQWTLPQDLDILRFGNTIYQNSANASAIAMGSDDQNIVPKENPLKTGVRLETLEAQTREFQKNISSFQSSSWSLLLKLQVLLLYFLFQLICLLLI